MLPYLEIGNNMFKKLANFKNHRRFTIRCLSQKITPVSLRFKRNIKMERGKKIIEKAEKQLMDERVRQINSTIDICNHLIYTGMDELKGKMGPELFDECQVFIDRIREWGHRTVLERHLIKYNRLCQKTKGGHSKHPGGCSNYTGFRAQSKETRISSAETSNSNITTTTTSRDTADTTKISGS